MFGGEFTATNETPLWTFNFRKYRHGAFSLEICFRALTHPLPTPTGERLWRKQAAKSWVSFCKDRSHYHFTFSANVSLPTYPRRLVGARESRNGRKKIRRRKFSPIFFALYDFPLAPTNCPWVSEDVTNLEVSFLLYDSFFVL